MLTPIARGPETGRTRWELLRDRAAGFVERLPLGSEAWTVVFNAADPAVPGREWQRTFSARLSAAADRDRLSSSLRTFAPPGQANGTWLRQATALALDQVEIAGNRNPDAYLTVLVYTDGVDQGHGRTSAEMRRNPGSSVSQSEIDRRIRQLRGKFRNFNVVTVYRPGDETVLDAQVVRLLTNRLQLANPLVTPRQEFPLALAFTDTPALKLSGRELGLSLEFEGGTRLPLKVGEGAFRMQTEPMPVSLEATGDWPAGKDVRARLRLAYPKVEGVFLVAEGGDAVELLIQGAEAPGISELLPEDGSAFPVGREVNFSLTTLASARVTWDFGDGRQAEGSTVRHQYTEPGRRKVTVKVTDPRNGLSSTQAIQVEAVRLAVTLDPFPPLVEPNREVTLTASADGEFSGFQWNVGGQVYAGRARPDGGSALTIAFDRPGPVQVAVIGEGSRGGNAESAAATLQVREVPELRVTSPASGDTLFFGTTRELTAEVEGVRAQRVRFSLLGEDGTELLPAREVDVQKQGDIRIAVLRIEVPRLQGRIPARLRAETVGAEPREIVRDVSMFLEREPTILQIMLPEGPEPFHGRPTPLRLEANAPLKEVRWDFGDGRGLVDGSEVQRHAWESYGSFSVRAVARDPDGALVEASPVTVTVPVRPVRAEALLILDGEAVGGDTGKVGINSNLELRANEQGDVKRLRWFLDGQELPEGQKTITVSDRGQHELELYAEGTPEAGESRSLVTFRASDPLLFWSILAALLVVFLPLARLLWGNGPRRAVFEVRTDGCQGDPDAAERKIGSLFSQRDHDDVAGIWDWWRKQAVLDPEKLDNNRPEAIMEDAWRDRYKLRFDRSDGYRVVYTPLTVNLQIRPLGENGDKQFRWEVEREISHCRLSDTDRNQHNALLLFMRLGRSSGLSAIWVRWPEALLVILLGILVLGIRELIRIFL